ncbi:MAG TPA: hypothetical protein V6D17_10535 [Candidatus Obscuribacterales bacterium]
MKARGKFICTLLVIDTFLVSFAAGFNSRQVKVIDPSLPPVQARQQKPAKEAGKAYHPAQSARTANSGTKKTAAGGTKRAAVSDTKKAAAGGTKEAGANGTKKVTASTKNATAKHSQ